MLSLNNGTQYSFFGIQTVVVPNRIWNGPEALQPGPYRSVYAGRSPSCLHIRKKIVTVILLTTAAMVDSTMHSDD